jgi:hypothetical protein
MENTNNRPNLNIDLSSTQPLSSPEGNHIFAEGMILRKVSKFVAGTPEDAIIPIPVVYDIKTGKILAEMLPKELREEYANI